jgi:hypothetical protein
MTNFSKLTKNQRHVLGLIAMGEDGGHSDRTLDSLVKRGLIERQEQSFGDGLGSIYRYSMPLSVHMAWCAWCAERNKVE